MFKHIFECCTLFFFFFLSLKAKHIPQTHTHTHTHMHKYKSRMVHTCNDIISILVEMSPTY
eukprot:NODE_7062_length_246_cov_11.203046_g6979_i0.p3 GENE.NODE_7062_length_246_cov_11.203046_g6979_i0~~NODE_7062_length_246_cov_11.203046_g6979_i0.p3  ORF type:complete len:61 (-),score=15.56 NODE_7062_length_246_cov_11.203046_g6979_i0:26-208(-)